MANAKRRLTPEQQREKMLSILTPVVSVLLALIVGAIIIAFLGKNPVQGYGAMLQGSLGDINKIGKTLERACPLIFTSLAAVFAYKCGVFNLGGEGQFIMGACAFFVASSCGVLFVKFFNLFLPKDAKINPLIGNAGVSAVPAAARVSQEMGLKYDKTNYLLMHAMGPNVAGVIGSAVAAGVLLAFLA